MNILVVDDQPRVLDQIKELLTQQGHSVQTAPNGLDGYGKAQQRHFDLYIIDHLMPLMNGIQLSKNLKQLQSTALTPIIFMTTQDIDNVKALVDVSLLHAIIAKPIDVELLQSMIYLLPQENTLLHSL